MRNLISRGQRGSVRDNGDHQDGIGVTIDDLTSQYGSFTAVDHVSMQIEPGEFTSLLGPSGSGKTTLLMNLAGFQPISSGTIHLGDTNITRTPPNRRNLGVVFQRYALFPHMSVAANIEYPLRLRGLSARERRVRCEHALELVGLGAFAFRKPHELSGGQAQRVALARVLVYRPPLILFDEPLGALDRGLREQVQLEIRRLNRELGITMLFVTHDQEEALIMSNRVALMRDGRIEQFGEGRDIYDHPKSMFAAGFLGKTNLLEAKVVHQVGTVSDIQWEDVVIERADTRHLKLAVDDTVVLAVRPEKVRLHTGTAGPNPFTVDEVVFSGPTTSVTLIRGDLRILASGVSSDPHYRVQPGDLVDIELRAGDIAVLEPEVPLEGGVAPREEPTMLANAQPV
jgi:ABC-type Fe3+/spermidine/putrescine transport system ATPase subunit